MIERILEKILKLNTIYTSLLELAKEKTEVLKGKDYEAVGRITEKEQNAIDLARATERERMDCVELLAKEWGMDAERITAAMLIGKCDTDKAKKMGEAVSALSSTLRTLKEQNEKNARLLEIKLRMTSFILDAAREGGSGDPGNYYTMDGTELDRDAQTRPRFIDSEI